FNAQATDQLIIHGSTGNDTIDASSLAAGTINLTIDGDAGDDVLIGSAGNDTIIGGAGTDQVVMGAGDDTFIWNPGDGNDVVEGREGNDTMVFNGSRADETINITANGTRVRFTRDVGQIVMDLAGIERVDFNALDGADTINVGDLNGTDLTELN